MSTTVPPGVAVIRFHNTDQNGWYGLVLVTKDGRSKVFRGLPYDLAVMSQTEFTIMRDNTVPKMAQLWADSLRGANASPDIRKLLTTLAAAKEVEHV